MSSRGVGRGYGGWLVREFLRVLAGNIRSLAAGLPALLAAALAIALASQVATTTDDQRLSYYLREALLRAEARDFDTAAICYERLIQDTGARPEYRYAHAMVLQAKGDRDRAAFILRQLAPVDRQGYPPAHLAIARALAAGPDRSERTARAVELHLKHALDGPDGVEAGELLGRLYASTGRGEAAVPYLLSAADRRPELLLLLARLARLRNDEAKAKEHLEQAARVFRTRAEARHDDPEARVNWAAAVALRDDFAAAVTILERGLTLSADTRYRRVLAGVYAAWYEGLARGTSSAPGARLEVLERGLRHDPNNLDLLDRMAAVLRAGGAEAGKVRASLRTSLAEGKATAATHFVLGVAPTARGRPDEARLHWEQAFRLDPGMAEVANNLAWVLAHADEPDLPRALGLADRAVRSRPDDARFRGTRGVVLMKLGRWSEALTDLEAELASDPDRGKTHQALAQVYEKLGSPDLAAEHRSRAAAGSGARPAGN